MLGHRGLQVPALGSSVLGPVLCSGADVSVPQRWGVCGTALPGLHNRADTTLPPLPDSHDVTQPAAEQRGPGSSPHSGGCPRSVVQVEMSFVLGHRLWLREEAAQP